MHPELHVPLAQYGVEPEHDRPHAPQLNGSEPVSTHAPLQLVVAPAHPQRPEMHDSLSGQTRPHAPQLLRSLLGSRQRPPQSIIPPGQPHTPPLQF